MPIPFAISAERLTGPLPVGGFAPQSVSICLRRQTAALAVLLVVLVAAVAFAWVLILAVGSNVVSSWPAHSEVYRSPMEPAAVCKLVTGVCVMSTFSANAAVRRKEPALDKLFDELSIVPKPAMRVLSTDDPLHFQNVRRALLAGADLSEPQMFAMMNMSAEHRQQAIWHYARQNIFELPPFTLSTFRELSERGLAEKPEGSKYHRLTPAASPLAAAVADELVRRYKIHAPILVHTRERTHTITFRCTCGWSCGLTAGRNMQVKASRAFTSHLASINAIARLETALAPRHQGET